MTDQDRAQAAHAHLATAEDRLQAAFVALGEAFDAYPDDTGKFVPYTAALATLAQAIKQVQALDVSARSWRR